MQKNNLPATTLQTNIARMWLLNVFPGAGFFYINGLKAFKYVIFIWIAEFLIFRSEFTVFVYFLTSIICTVLMASKGALKGNLESRYAELYPQGNFQRLIDQERRIAGKLDLDGEECGFAEEDESQQDKDVIVSDTANSASQYLIVPPTKAQIAMQDSLLEMPDIAKTYSAYKSREDIAKPMESNESLLSGNSYNATMLSPEKYNDAVLAQGYQSTASDGYQQSVPSPEAYNESLLTPEQYNDSLPSPASLAAAPVKPSLQNAQAALAKPSSTQPPASTSTQPSSSGAPGAAARVCPKCGVTRQWDFTFCITCGCVFE